MLIVESNKAKNIADFSDAPNEIEFLHKSKSNIVLIDKLENRVLNSLEVAIDGVPPIYGTIYKVRIE